MPFASQSHEFMAVWTALQAGDMDTAQNIIESSQGCFPNGQSTHAYR